MDLLFTREAAKRSLSAAGETPKKLATIHIGAVTLLSLVLAIVNYLLAQGVDSTAGLSGIGHRAVLNTLQFVLSAGSSLALPFWEVGFLFSMLAIARGQEATPDSLLEGFRRFWPLLRLFLLQILIFTGLAITALQLASMIFLLTPLSSGAQEVLDGLAAQDPALLQQTLTDEALVMKLLPHLIPIYILFVLIYAGIGIPLFYRFRMANFAIADGCPRAGAAMQTSARLMRGNRWSLFLVDLRFWWFYAGQLLISLIAYTTELLTLFGVTLPFAPEVGVLVSYLVYLVLQFFFFRQFGSYVHATYAHCYEVLFPTAPQSPAPPAGPVPRDP